MSGYVVPQNVAKNAFTELTLLVNMPDVEKFGYVKLINVYNYVS